MKNYLKKIIISILIFCVSTFSLSACTFTFNAQPREILTFTLTKQDVENFNEVVKVTKENLPKATSILSANSYVSDLVNGMTFITEQNYVAQILYFADTSNTQNEENFNFATEAYNTARAGYIDVLKTLWNSNSVLKDALFQGMSEEEINAFINVPDRVIELQNENNELLNDYYALSDEELELGTGPIYAEMITNYNEIASISNFKNYYHYASNYVYERDYESTELSKMLTYVKNYVKPLYMQLVNKFRSVYGSLSEAEKVTVSKITSGSYNEQPVNYVSRYVASLPTPAKNGMNDMFKNNNYLVATSENAREGAFTAPLPYNNTPYCYFGPGYANVFTIIHEVGHYYAYLYNINEGIPVDIAEIHSQANEMMLLVFLKQELSPNVYEAVKLSSVLDVLSACLISTLMNEFEMRVFATNVKDYTSNDFNAIMNDVVNDFDYSFVTNYLTKNINEYWKRAIVQQPCYYISYAVSGISALGLYSEASVSNEGYQNALNKYINLCQNADLSLGLLAILDDIDMLSPFEEDTYITLQNSLIPTTQTTYYNLLVA